MAMSEDTHIFNGGGTMGRLCCYIAIAALVVASALSTDRVMADPCLVVYPSGPCIYHYDINEYYTVGPGHPYYDPGYDRGGEVLLEINTDSIDESIYQAPGLNGFEISTDNREGYFFFGTDFDLILDGFSNSPVTYENILLVFDDFFPSGCYASEITVDGMPATGGTYAVGDLVVSTPTESGNNYSDTETFQIHWRGCLGVHIWAFADDNYNGVHDGEECFTAFSHDLEVPAESSSWGAMKSILE